jgi:hypothetical protein
LRLVAQNCLRSVILGASQSSNSAVNKSQTGSLIWNANHTLNTLNIADTFNSANRQTCTDG